MRIRRGAPLLAGGVALSLVLAACGGTGEVPSGEGDDKPVVLRLTEPQNKLVPTNTAETQGSEVLHALFDALVTYDENQQPVNVVADSVSTEDNKEWTIKIKDGWTFHNGEPVNAESFARAWNHGANQENKQESGYFFERIEGFADLNPGEGKKPKTDKMSGLEVVDDQTLKVTLSEPYSGFGVMLGYTAFYPLPEAAFDDKGEITDEFQEKPIGNGPFTIDKPYKKGTDQEIDMTRYDKYPGEKINFEKLKFRFITEEQTAFNELQAGNIDIIDQLGGPQMAAAKAYNPEGLVEGTDAGILYLGVPLNNKKQTDLYGEQNDADMRKAISMAIDRETIAEKQLSGTRSAADDFINPLIPGYKEGSCEACAYQPEEAKKAYEAVGGPKKLDMTYNADGPGNKEFMEAAANNLRANLGIKVDVKPIAKFAEALELYQQRKNDRLFRIGWAADYPSAENYLGPMFATGAIKEGSNYSGYTNDEFDKLVKEGDQAESPEAAVEKYRAAADVLIRDMPYIPLFFYKKVAISSKNVTGLDIDFQNHVKWSEIRKAGN